MAKTKEKKSRSRGSAIVRYLRDTRSELRKVHWPSREEAWGLTKYVLLVTVVMAAFLGFLDFVFALELRGVIDRSAVAIAIAAVVVVVSIVATLVLKRRAA